MRRRKPLKVYLDHEMISAKGKKDMPPAEQAALEAIDRAANVDKCELVTSKVSAEEIALYKGKAKPAIELVYQAMPKVPYTERQKLLGNNSFGDQYTWISSPMIEDNPKWLSIRQLGLADKDAPHVMLASQASCEVLLTGDGGLLHRAAAILKQEKLRVMKPTALCKEMGWD
jgi:hypothetical protein